MGGAFIPPGGNPYFVALYVPSIKGAHAYVQFYQYGSFEKTGEYHLIGDSVLLCYFDTLLVFLTFC